MFSREDVANFVNQNFEPTWEMVRPVPIVRIDFGNGRTSTRTLHGNVATYVCAANGQVVDILPGIYQPAAFMAALAQPRAEAVAIPNRPAPDVVQQRLREYHRGRAQLVRQSMQQARQIVREVAIPDRGKGRIERPVEQQMMALQAAINQHNAAAAMRRPRTASELANWLPLAEDSRRNETERRLQIHDRLMGAGEVQPEQIKRWLYREVLHADLDDPHMGLGDDFFADFERE